MTIEITLPFKTPSVNTLYFTNRYTGRRTKSTEARQLCERIKTIINDIGDIGEFKYDLEEWIESDLELKVTIDIYENWYTKKLTIKKKDVANREKFILDSVFEVLGLEDSTIFTVTLNKVQSMDEEKAVVIIDTI